MMVDVLRRLGGSGLRAAYPNLLAYVGRAEGRPAFRRSFDAQRAFFDGQMAVSKAQTRSTP